MSQHAEENAHESAVFGDGPMNSKLVKRFRRGGSWMLVCRAMCMAVVLGNYALLARVLPTEGFATYILISSIVVFCSMAAMFGLDTLVCRYISESFAVGDSRRAQFAAFTSVRLGMITVPLVGMLGWFAARHLGEAVWPTAQLEQFGGLIAVWVMLLAIGQIVAEAFRGLHKLRIAGLLSGVSGGLVANLGLLFSLALCQFMAVVDLKLIVALTAATLFIPICLAIAYLCIIWPKPPADEITDHNLEPLTIRNAIREATPIMLVQVLGFGMAQLDIWVVGACCAEQDLAIYGAVRRLSLLVAVPLTQIGFVVGSSISELHARRDQQNLQRILRAAASVAALAMAIPMLALAVFPEAILGVVFGPDFQAGATALRIVLLGQLVYVFTGLCGPTLMMTGHQRVPLWALVATLPLVHIAPFAAVNHGLPGVAGVFAAVIAGQNLLQWLVVRFTMGIKTHPDLSPKYLTKLLSDFRPFGPYRRTVVVAAK